MIGFYIVLVLGCTVEPIVTGKNEINQDTDGVAGAPSVADGVNELARTSPVTAEQAIESTVAAMLAIESTVSAELAIGSTVAAAIDATRTVVDAPSVTDDLQDITPLHLAAETNSIDIARLLIDSGADIEAKDNDGLTPMHWAAETNSLDLVRLLIDRGADIEAKDNDGLTPMHLAGETNSLDVVRLLIDRGANNDDSITLPVESAVLPTLTSELVKIKFIDGLVPVVNKNEYFRIANFRVSNVEELNSLGGVSASVKWGDGSDWIGVPIMVDTGEILAGHTYTSAGIFNAEMRIRSDTGDVVNTSFSVLVEDPPIIPSDSLPDNALVPSPAVSSTMPGTVTSFSSTSEADVSGNGIILFAKNCTGCHSTGGKTVVGPGLAGVADRAATRVAGLSAEEYLEQSLRKPGAFVVDGFPMVMPEWSHLGNDSIDALVTYLQTLK